MADREKILTQHPLLYHMAEAGAWENIQRHGLLSTTALLTLFDVSEPRRSAIGSWYRKRREVICHSDYGCAAIRDQTPMPPGKLGLALTDMDPSEWYKLLNGKVFFLVDRKSAEIIFEGQITPGPASRRTHCLHSFVGRTACNRNNAISHQLRNRSRAHAQTGFEHLPNDSRSQL